MKKIAAAIIFCSSLVVMSTPSIAAPTSYPLKCRGGAFTAIGFRQYNASNSQLILGFRKGTKPANQGLSPGECSWLDRGLHPTEPSSICHHVSDVFISTTYVQEASFHPSDLQLVQTAWSNSAPYLKLWQDPNGYFTVNVYNDGASCMVVTSVID